jgi:hypothetical protein
MARPPAPRCLSVAALRPVPPLWRPIQCESQTVPPSEQYTRRGHEPPGSLTAMHTLININKIKKLKKDIKGANSTYRNRRAKREEKRDVGIRQRAAVGTAKGNHGGHRSKRMQGIKAPRKKGAPPCWVAREKRRGAWSAYR